MTLIDWCEAVALFVQANYRADVGISGRATLNPQTSKLEREIESHVGDAKWRQDISNICLAQSDAMKDAFLQLIELDPGCGASLMKRA